jgi:sigma-B regulation protein RsbU (phosphoserine phosphatase)
LINAAKQQLRIKELELNSLLEITQAINNNLPEDSLYKIYNFTLRANLNISKLALYILNQDNTWQSKVCFGTEVNFTQIPIEPAGLNTREVSILEKVDLPQEFKEFDIVIPVYHKDKVLAYVFVTEMRKDGQEHSIDTTFVQTLTNIMVVAIENKKLARRQLAQEALNKELEIAQQVQTMLFPKKMPNNASLQVKAYYFPHHSIGGDYYDFIEIDKDKFLLGIADVSGKGVPAALLMSNFQASLRILARRTTNLEEIVRELNYVIYQNSGGGSFITFFCGLYERDIQRFSFINAGHNPPFFCDENGQIQLLEKGTTVLGVFHPLPFLDKVVIEKVQSFLLMTYTDGVVETRNEEDEEFGHDRLMQFFEENIETNPDELHTKLVNLIDGFRSGNQYADDVTLFSCRVRKT